MYAPKISIVRGKKMSATSHFDFGTACFLDENFVGSTSKSDAVSIDRQKRQSTYLDSEVLGPMTAITLRLPVPFRSSHCTTALLA